MLTSDVDSLPNFELRSDDPVTRALVEAGCADFHTAARHVSALPYGRNSDRADYRRVLGERRGTCSTKHALLAHVARAAGAPVELWIGVYEMNEHNTPGVGPVLAAHGLESIPEAHCYLRCGAARVDLTRSADRAGEPIAKLLREEPITPDQIGDHKLRMHRRFLERWVDERPELGRTLDEIWRVREACIAALAAR